MQFGKTDGTGITLCNFDRFEQKMRTPFRYEDLVAAVIDGTALK